MGKELDLAKESGLNWGLAGENSPIAEKDNLLVVMRSMIFNTGMPCMLPLVEDAGVLMSAWASTWYEKHQCQEMFWESELKLACALRYVGKKRGGHPEYNSVRVVLKTSRKSPQANAVVPS